VSDPSAAETVRALLLVLPAEGEAALIPPSAPVAGLPLVRRVALTAERAGYDACLMGGLGPGDRDLLAGTAAAPLVADAPPLHPPGRIVLLDRSVIPQAPWLRQLREMPLAPDRLYVDDGSVAVVDASKPERVVDTVARSATAGEALTALAGAFKTVSGALEGAGHFRLRGPRDLRAAESWLLRSLVKPNEGFMSRHFERRISLAITRRLTSTPITPNAMTLISLAVGMVGAALFLSPSLQLAGALLFLAHSILDGCDGELARLTFRESPNGAALDFWGDNLVHAAAFTGMTLGWARHAGAPWPLLLGAVAVAATAAVALVVYRRGILARAPEGEAVADRVVEALTHRDFIYLIVALAVVGKVYWFIAFTAVGAPVFLLLLLWTGRGPRTA
jgi:phosphatidylglycerophosphate synthase